MTQIDTVKKRIREKRHNYSNNVKSRYVNLLITRLLLSVIVFFSVLIVTNYSIKARDFIKEKALKENISFSHITNLYNKYLGFVFPIKENVEDTTVFNEKIEAKSIEPYREGYSLEVGRHYLVSVINSGIVAYIGEKEGYGHTVIIEGVDEIEYWYGGLENISVNLYDYVSAKSLLGNTQEEELYLVFKKNGEYLDYEEVME